MKNDNYEYKVLVESLKLLHLDYKSQIKIIPGFAYAPDEIVLAYMDAFLLLPQLIRNGCLSNSVLAILIQLFNHVNWMWRNGEECLNFEQMESSEIWMHTRDLASRAIEELGETPENIDLGHLSWHSA